MIGWILAGTAVAALVLGRGKIDDKFTPGGLEPGSAAPEPFPEQLGLSFQLDTPAGYRVVAASPVHDRGGRDYTVYELQRVDNPVTGAGDEADLAAQAATWWVVKWNGRNAWLTFQASEVPPVVAPLRLDISPGETRGIYRQGSGSASEVKTMRRDWQV